MGPRFSIIPATAVCDAALTTLDLRVLALLGVHTDENGWCYRNQARMATELNVARQSVCRSIARLERHGYLEKADINQAAVDAGRRKKGMRSICVYRVTLDARQGPTQEVIDAQLDGETGANVEKTAESSLSPQRDNRCHPGETTVVTQVRQPNVPLRTPPLDSSSSKKPKTAPSSKPKTTKNKSNKEKKKEGAGGVSDLKGGRQGRLPNTSPPQTPEQSAKQAKEREIEKQRKEAVAVFNENAERCGMLPVRNLTQARKTMLDALFSREPNDWRAGFEKLATAVFPTPSGWSPRFFDVLVSEQVFNNLLEGQFDPPKSARIEADVISLELKRWRLRVRAWVDGGKQTWPSDWGAPIGQKGCIVPDVVLREFSLSDSDSDGESATLTAEKGE